MTEMLNRLLIAMNFWSKKGKTWGITFFYFHVSTNQFNLIFLS